MDRRLFAAAAVAEYGTLHAGTYTLSEPGAYGYIPVGLVCLGGAQSGTQVALTVGQSATCTFTNQDQTPKLTVTKVVVNDNGGTKLISDFPLFAGATSMTSGVQKAVATGTCCGLLL